MEKIKMNIDETLTRIEEITSQLENGSVPLDEALELYKEGATLIVQCNKMLAEAELTLSKIKFELTNENNEAQDE